jgi:hypothetical protein
MLFPTGDCGYIFLFFPLLACCYFVVKRRKRKVPGDGNDLAETVDVDVLVLVDLGKELAEGGVHGWL